MPLPVFWLLLMELLLRRLVLAELTEQLCLQSSREAQAGASRFGPVASESTSSAANASADQKAAVVVVADADRQWGSESERGRQRQRQRFATGSRNGTDTRPFLLRLRLQ